MCLLHYRTRVQLIGVIMVKIKVRISHVAINKVFYKTGDELEVTQEKAAELGNAVTIVKEELTAEQPVGKKAKSP